MCSENLKCQGDIETIKNYLKRLREEISRKSAIRGKKKSYRSIADSCRGRSWNSGTCCCKARDTDAHNSRCRSPASCTSDCYCSDGSDNYDDCDVSSSSPATSPGCRYSASALAYVWGYSNPGWCRSAHSRSAYRRCSCSSTCDRDCCWQCWRDCRSASPAQCSQPTWCDGVAPSATT